MARARRATQRKETGVKGARILIVEARYYEDIADMLLRGAKRVLRDAQATFEIVTVPGALEIPGAIVIALDGAADREQPYDGVVAHAGRQRHPHRRYRRAGQDARQVGRRGQRRRRGARRAHASEIEAPICPRGPQQKVKAAQ
jgi:hypothetical protein